MAEGMCSLTTDSVDRKSNGNQAMLSLPPHTHRISKRLRVRVQTQVHLQRAVDANKLIIKYKKL